jgi:hypothetical protein
VPWSKLFTPLPQERGLQAASPRNCKQSLAPPIDSTILQNNFRTEIPVEARPSIPENRFGTSKNSPPPALNRALKQKNHPPFLSSSSSSSTNAQFKMLNLQSPIIPNPSPRGINLGCSMLDVRCWMFDVGCSMLDVRCWMFDVGCSMLDVRCWMFDVGCSMLDVRCWMLDVRCFPHIFLSAFRLPSSAFKGCPLLPRFHKSNGLLTPTPGRRITCV